MADILQLSRNELIAVGTSAVVIADSRAESVPRKALYVRNSSTGGQDVTVLPSNARSAVALYGIVLKPGESWVDSTSEGYKCWQGSVSAIASAAGGQVSVFEE